MSHPLETARSVGRLVVRAALDDRVTFLAASIAFYAVVSIFPLLLLLLALGSLIGGEEFASVLLGFVQDFITPEAEAIVEEALLSAAAQGGAGLIGAVMLVWSGLKVFIALDIGFSEVYGEVAAAPTFLRTLLNAVTVLLAIAAGFLALFGLRWAVRRLVPTWWVGLVSPLLIFLAIVLLFFPMYLVFPGVKQRPRDVLPGTLFAAAGWAVLAELFGFYAANAGTFALFGFIGGMLLLLMWFYVGATILLIGAILNAVLAGRFRDPDVEIDEAPPLANDEERPIGGGNDAQRERDE